MKKHQMRGEVERLVVEGKSLSEISLELGVSGASLSSWVREWGLDTSVSRRKLREEDLAEDVERGLSRLEIMEKYGVSMGCVHKALTRAGLVAKKKKRVEITRRDEEMREMREGGFSLQDIGNKMGMTREGVRISLLKQGVKPTRTRSVWVREKMEARAEGAERLVEEIVREKGGLLREMVLRGSSFNDVREYLGVSRKVVCRVYDELKLSAEVVERRGERDEEIKRLYEKGFCIVEVAGEVGVSHVTVMRVLKRMGVETRRGRRRRRGVDTFLVDGEG